MLELAYLVLGLAVGAAAAWAAAVARTRAGLDAAQRVNEARLEEQRRLLQEERERVEVTYKALSGDALRAANEQFLQLATQTLDARVKEQDGDLGKREEAIQGLVKPLGDALAKYELQVQALEEKRQKAYGSLDEQLRKLGEAQAMLQKETGTLANALRNPQVRGKWGEIHLKRTVELAGMVEHCDFIVQATFEGEQGRLRPDLVVKLPGDRAVVVDAKAPLSGYLDAIAAATPEERQRALAHFARQMRAHVKALSEKAYWEQFDGAPDFVVMFVPQEAFLGAALEADPRLFEEAFASKVVLAGPSTLFTLLKTVATGWRQEKVAENAEEVSALGRELYARLATLTEHFAGIGRGLSKTVDSYNKAIGSYETRVLSQARRFEEYGAAGPAELGELEPVVVAPRIPRGARDGGE